MMEIFNFVLVLIYALMAISVKGELTNADDNSILYSARSRYDSPSGSISGCTFYKKIKARGYKICPKFSSCSSVSVNGGSASAYLENAYCACSSIPAETKANKIRRCLQTRMLAAARAGVKNWTTSGIYKDHVVCYRSAGCPCGPASYWSWIAVTRVNMQFCGAVRNAIYAFGRCSNCRYTIWKYSFTTCRCPPGW